MAHLHGTIVPTASSVRRLKVTYTAGLALIAACLLVFAAAMLNIIPSQNDDAHIVNLAGRQRMLSQRLFKVLLLLADEHSPDTHKELRHEINELVSQWDSAHHYLASRDSVRPVRRSDSINALLRAQDPYFNRMVEIYGQITGSAGDDTTIIRRAIAEMRYNEPPFLELQEQITDQFQHEADSRLELLSAIATGSFIALFLLIIIVGSLVLRPMANQIESSIEDLTRTNSELITATEEKKLSEENMRRLLMVYPDLTLVFDENGVYIDIFTSSHHLLYRDREHLLGRRLHEVFPQEQADFFYNAIHTTLQTLRPTSFTYTLPLTTGEVTFRATMTFFEKVGGHRHAVMFIRDITSEIEAKNRERRYQQELLQTIIETQEHERARIAADMHDGIGQMFAVLKLNIASLRREEEQELFDDALESIDTIVSELRSIAWNLMPVSLERFGLVSTLRSEVEILQQRFGITVHFVAETATDRYPAAIEICIYRIAQELLANIIKHSHARLATVSLTESAKTLSLDIRDDGQGFDSSKRPERQEGRGLVSIQSRVLALGGTVVIDSSKDTGSRIHVDIPLPLNRSYDDGELRTNRELPHDRDSQNSSGRRPQTIY